MIINTLTGLEKTETLAETIEKMQFLFANSLPNMIFSPENPITQLIAINANLLHDFTDIIMSRGNLDIEQLDGIQLDQYGALKGVLRNKATYSEQRVSVNAKTGTILIGADEDYTKNNIFQVLDVFGNLWLLSKSYTFATDSVQVLNFRAKEQGRLTTAINSITSSQVYVNGVVSVINTEVNHVTGQDSETPFAYRKRIKTFQINLKENDLDILYKELISKNGVTNVKIFRNNTNTTNENNIEPNKVLVIVAGGESADIGNALYNSSNLIYQKFDNSEKTEKLSLSGQLITSYFSRPIENQFYIKIVLKKIDINSIIDETLFKDYITNFFIDQFDQAIYSTKIIANIVTYIQNTNLSFNLLSCMLSTNNVDFNNSIETSNIFNKWVLIKENISIIIQ